MKALRLAGRATAQETHWVQSQGLKLSSLGMGTYIGAPDTQTDQLMSQAVLQAVNSGVVNVIDTAINYRYQKSQRAIGSALQQLAQNGITRQELFISSKIGYLPQDGDSGQSAEELSKELVNSKLVKQQDIIGGVHCMQPAFLQNQLQKSLQNLKLDTIDLMYLHNSAQSQLPVIKSHAFYTKLASAFEYMEKARSEGKIGMYGLATWICFRSLDPLLSLSLERVVETAQKVAGNSNGFKYVQLPINIMMPQGFVQKWQTYKDSQEIFLNVATQLGVQVQVSQPLLQGKLLNLKLSKELTGVEPQSARHLQLIRSIPSSAIKTVLVGMKNPRNVEMNLQLGYVDKLTSEEFWQVLKPENKPDAKIKINLR